MSHLLFGFYHNWVRKERPFPSTSTLTICHMTFDAVGDSPTGNSSYAFKGCRLPVAFDAGATNQRKGSLVSVVYSIFNARVSKPAARYRLLMEYQCPEQSGRPRAPPRPVFGTSLRGSQWLEAGFVIVGQLRVSDLFSQPTARPLAMPPPSRLVTRDPENLLVRPSVGTRRHTV